jgi:hypothetical protein
MSTVGWHDGKRLIAKTWYDPEFGFLLPQSELLARGWTKAKIRKEIGEPDCFGVNPKGGSHVLLYSETRVRRTKFKIAGGINA